MGEVSVEVLLLVMHIYHLYRSSKASKVAGQHVCVIRIILEEKLKRRGNLLEKEKHRDLRRSIEFALV